MLYSKELCFDTLSLVPRPNWKKKWEWKACGNLTHDKHRRLGGSMNMGMVDTVQLPTHPKVQTTGFVLC